MAPIVYWVKDKLHARGSVYISRETILENQPTRASTGIRFDMHTSSMDQSGAKREPTTPERNPQTSSTTPNRVFNMSKYQLWPRSKKKADHKRQVSDDLLVNPQGRSPSSLSDTSVPPPNGPSYRGGSLSRRRKISVPELRQKPTPENFPSPIIDSPTIPGRPALRSVASDLAQHERSISCPDAPLLKRTVFTGESTETKSKDLRIPTLKPAWPLPAPSADKMAFNPTRPLSPIFSPIESTTPVSATPLNDGFEVPPQVPPKPEGSASPVQVPLRKESLRPSALPPLHTHISQAAASRPSSCYNSDRSSPTRKATASPKSSISIPGSIPEERSPTERGRGVGRTKSKSGIDDIVDYATLPTGLRPIEAAIMLPEVEKETLRKQASSQAERFEILGAKHVNNLSKELRNLDERCDYLRNTYKSLREGRQKLHNRLVSYLKSENLIFSKERLLKQEEALIELDRAIDDWAIKLERAENRRLRVRQKLLEHVAASMMLNLASVQPGYGLMASPPPSAGGMNSVEPLQVNRKDIESIKIYADTQVLSLFTDIEHAIGRMCETAC